ncbi:unnamed protein product [Miscanthus lutarioriparius]|uniref:Protein kinase domain-containing protein n=1 Tax=Miscanthus lutarioriparius TaxID=422564 RepID=A0A811S9C7_9POAL|nr:unnamed protein product [Miscanthus lutarioriparius]
MEAATKGFTLESKIGSGSFGTVYRGYLPDGREVAIKREESGPRDDLRFALLSLTEWQARTREHQTVAGTVGYMDPEYYSLHHLTVKSDVYNFGVVMLEVLTGKHTISEEFISASPLSVVDYAIPSIV